MDHPSDSLAAARYSQMRWNTPLSLEHADLLLQRLAVRPGESVLDLGCGWGELLVRLASQAGVSGTGVDTDESLLARGRARAAELAADVRFVHGAAADWTGSADVVLCVGASHAWAGIADPLVALTTVVQPGGRLLFGDASWDRPPNAATAEMFDEVQAFEAVVGRAVAAGWRVLHVSTADQREWDDFEGTWRAGRQLWLVEHPDDPGADEVRQLLDAQLDNYVGGYRGVLGFCYLVLVR